MANDVMFEGKERRMAKIEKFLAENDLGTLEEARELCLSKGVDVDAIVKGVQPIAFENAVWAYTLGVALALKRGVTNAAEASAVIGEGLQAFCVPGSVASTVVELTFCTTLSAVCLTSDLSTVCVMLSASITVVASLSLSFLTVVRCV